MTAPTDSGLKREKPAEVDLPAGEIRVLESHHAPMFRMPLGSWPFHKICWVAIGNGHVEGATPSSRSYIQKDDFLILPAGITHRFVDHPKQPLTLIILCISDDYISGNSNPELPLLWHKILDEHDAGKPLLAKTAFHYNTVIEHFRNAIRQQSTQATGWKTALGGLANHILISLARHQFEVRASYKKSKWHAIQDAIEYADAHPYQPLTIEHMAEQCQMSPRRFTTLFKNYSGQTFNHYLTTRRIEYSQQRLKETRHILYACYEAGFNDPAYFYRVFKKHTGMTPGDYVRKVSR
ncbi:MAG: AraC family transcriptional regulator [Verrucomicrobiota bacterium]